MKRPVLSLDRPVRGIFVKLAAAEVLDLVAASNFDLAVIDLEHSLLDTGEALRLIRHGALLGLPLVVRIPAVDPGLVNRALEAGAAGIQLSSVRTAQDLRRLRRACRYSPDGTRSVSLAHPMAAYGRCGLAEYIRQASDAPLVVAQIETATTDDDLDTILAERPDVAFIGMTDLTVDLGFDAETIKHRVTEIIEATQRCGVVLGAAGLDDPRVVYDVSLSDTALLRESINSKC